MPHRRARIERGSSQWLRGALGRSLIIIPLLLAGPLMVYATAIVASNHVLFDFQGGLWNAGVAILHGHSPYQPLFLAHQAAIMRAGGVAQGETVATVFSVPVYPALPNVAVLPFSLLSLALAGSLYTLLSVVAMLGGLRLLGVRDWRCLAVAMLSWPFLFGLYLGAIGPFLLFGVGVAWRWRDRVVPPALAIAALVATKIFPWPLAVWLLVTRRYRALAMTVAIGLVLSFGAWAAIGFDGLAQYPRMLSEMTFLQQNRAVSIVAVLLIAGVSAGVATAVAVAVAALILSAAWRFGRRPDGDRRAFGLTILAALTATPIVWEHYMVLLFVPIALVSPRFSRAWLIPLLTPLTTTASTIIPAGSTRTPFTPDTLRTAVPWLVLEAMTAIVLCTTPEQRRAFRARLPRPPVAIRARRVPEPVA